MPSVPSSQVGGASRVALARLALDVVSTMPGVAGTDAGPAGLCVTADPPFGLLRGVAVIAQPDGRYEVDLCLVARMVPLVPLGEDIRQRLRARAARDGLADQLGTVNVEFSQALGADETMVEVLGPDMGVAAETSQGAGSLPSPPTVSAGSQSPLPPIPPAGPPPVPGDPKGSIGSQLPPPVPPGSPGPSPGSPGPAPASGCESRS